MLTLDSSSEKDSSEKVAKSGRPVNALSVLTDSSTDNRPSRCLHVLFTHYVHTVCVSSSTICLHCKVLKFPYFPYSLGASLFSLQLR